jgi:hypothetical protein
MRSSRRRAAAAAACATTCSRWQRRRCRDRYSLRAARARVAAAAADRHRQHAGWRRRAGRAALRGGEADRPLDVDDGGTQQLRLGLGEALQEAARVVLHGAARQQPHEVPPPLPTPDPALHHQRRGGAPSRQPTAVAAPVEADPRHGDAAALTLRAVKALPRPRVLALLAHDLQTPTAGASNAGTPAARAARAAAPGRAGAVLASHRRLRLLLGRGAGGQHHDGGTITMIAPRSPRPDSPSPCHC